MQTLQFEVSWDKQMADKDRKHITNRFHETKMDVQQGLNFVPIRIATNHRKHLLVIVLLHNFSEQEVTFDEKIVQLHYQEQTIQQAFTLPTFKLPAKTSMPWTFIFTEGHPVDLEAASISDLQLNEDFDC